MPDRNYQWLDLLRGVSALLVCANHLRGALFIDYAAVQRSSLLVKIFYFLTALGHQSVMIFFVLSGFLVGGSVIRRWHEFRYSSYMTSRLVRLWVVLVPALVFTAAIDHALRVIAPDVLSGSDLNTLNSGPTAGYAASPSTFLLNVLFLQTVIGPVFGSNSPLWSLSNEFWYYLAFPLVVFVVKKETPTYRRLLASLGLVTLGFLLADKAIGFGVWLTGVAAFMLTSVNRLSTPKMLWLSGPLFLGLVVLSKSRVVDEVHADLLVGAATALLLIPLCSLRPLPKWIAGSSNFLSKISYTLYLIHFPVVLLVYAVFVRGRQFAPSVYSILIFIAVLCFMVTLAYLAWMLFEKHTDSLRRRTLLLLEPSRRVAK